MSWQVLALISLVGTSAMLLIQRALLRQQKYDAMTYAVIWLVISAIFMAGYAVINPSKFGAAVPYLNIAIAIILYGILEFLYFGSLKLVPASTFIILFATRVVWTALISVPVLHESLSTLQIVGAILVLVAVYFINPIRHGTVKFNKGTRMVLVTALVAGVAFANDAAAVRHGFSVPLYLTAATIGPAVVVMLVRPSVLQKMKPLFKNPVFIKTALITGFLQAFQSIALYLAYQRAHNATVLVILNQFQVILVVLGGIWLLHERDNIKRKLTSTAIGLAGLILLVI